MRDVGVVRTLLFVRLSIRVSHKELALTHNEIDHTHHTGPGTHRSSSVPLRVLQRSLKNSRRAVLAPIIKVLHRFGHARRRGADTTSRHHEAAQHRNVEHSHPALVAQLLHALRRNEICGAALATARSSGTLVTAGCGAADLPLEHFQWARHASAGFDELVNAVQGARHDADSEVALDSCVTRAA